MNNSPVSSPQSTLPSLGLFALALTLATYAITQMGLVKPPAISLATVLLLGGGLQLLIGMQQRQQPDSTATATLLPLGLFWLSLIAFDVFPNLGLGHHPRPVVMVAYLSMWGFFAALLFLASFRQSRALQLVFGTLMICLLLLALSRLRDNPTFHLYGGVAGLISALVAVYTGVAQLCNQNAGRAIFPLGSLPSTDEKQLAP